MPFLPPNRVKALKAVTANKPIAEKKQGYSKLQYDIVNSGN